MAPNAPKMAKMPPTVFAIPHQSPVSHSLQHFSHTAIALGHPKVWGSPTVQVVPHCHCHYQPKSVGHTTSGPAPHPPSGSPPPPQPSTHQTCNHIDFSLSVETFAVTVQSSTPFHASNIRGLTQLPRHFTLRFVFSVGGPGHAWVQCTCLCLPRVPTASHTWLLAIDPKVWDNPTAG